MSRFRKLSHSLWHCQYHVVFVPKYRFRILDGEIATEVSNCIRSFSSQKECEIVELNIQIDHIHIIAFVPPKLSISDYLGIIKGRTAIRVFSKYRKLKSKPYYGNHLWARGYCVDTVGLDAEMIRKYVIHQEEQERKVESNQPKLF